MKTRILSRLFTLVLCLGLSLVQALAAFTHYTGTITGETGTLIAMFDTNLVASGWSIAQTASGVRVYRNGTGSSQRYWYVRDNGPNGTSTFKEAWIRGYGTKADALDVADASNTLQFPTAAQVTNGMVIRKSASADSTARTYHLYADARTVVGFIYTGDNAGQSMCFYFGDMYDLAGSSSLAAVTICRTTENSATQTNDGLQNFAAINKGYIIQSYTGAGGALSTTQQPIGPMASPTYASGYVAFPNGADGGRYLGQLAICESATPQATTVYRGRLRGLWYPLAGQSTYADLDTLTGSGALAGRSFTIHKVGAGFYALETSDTLEANDMGLIFIVPIALGQLVRSRRKAAARNNFAYRA